MRRKIFAGTTSVSVPIRVQDTSSTTGGGLSSLVFNTSGLVAEYRRQGQSSWTAITLVTNTLGTYTSGGFIADGSLAGSYEICPPDAAFVAGARWVAIRLYGAANMLPVLLEFELDAVNYQDAAGFGLSRLDAAVSTRSTYAGADTSGTTTLLTRVPGTLTVSGGKVAASLAAADVTGNLPANVTQWLAAAVTSAVSGFPDVNVRAVRGTTLVGTGNLPSDVVTIGGQGVSASGTITFPAATLASTVNIVTVGAVVGNVGGNVVGTVGSVAGAVGSVTAGVTVAGYSSGQDPATLVLDTAASGHNAANSVGAKINSAAASGDPWATVLPGSYVSGTAGNILGNKSGFILGPTGFDFITVETGINARQALALTLSATAGKSSGLDTSTAVFYAAGLSGTTTPRITATDDASGNRSATTLTPPA